MFKAPLLGSNKAEQSEEAKLNTKHREQQWHIVVLLCR